MEIILIAWFLMMMTTWIHIASDHSKRWQHPEATAEALPCPPPAAQGDAARVLSKVCFGNRSSLTSSVDSHKKKEFLQDSEIGYLKLAEIGYSLLSLIASPICTSCEKSDLQMGISLMFLPLLQNRGVM
jgi:hypothetical protein